MSLPVPLGVRLQTAHMDRHVTVDVRDLEYRSVAKGGFASCGIKLDRPLLSQPEEIKQYGRLYVYDKRNGQTVWEGRQEEPGRTNSNAGQVWDLNAVGPSAHLHDRFEPVIYVDNPLNRMHRVDNVTPGGTDGIKADPADAAGSRQSMLLQFPTGLALVTNSRVVMRYNDIQVAGQKLARIDFAASMGVTSASLAVQALARTDGNLATSDTARSFTFTTVGAGQSARVIVTNWTAGRNTIEWRIIYTGAGTTVAADTTWAALYDMVVLATRYDQAGTELLTAASYGNNHVFADQVVADLLGRWLNQFDGADASVDASPAYHIDQLAYPDGVDAYGVLEDLLSFEPAYTYAAWESNPYAGYAYNAVKNHFEWRLWPTTVRYEASVVDGFDSPGSGADVYDRVGVRHRHPDSTIEIHESTQTVQILSDAGLIRKAFIDIGDDVGSPANAVRVGQQFLGEHATAPNAGRLRIARPIYDADRGRMVMPWEIRPGYLIRVRGVLPYVNALNTTARDGVTVFKINAVNFRASDAVAELELDSYPLSVTQALADLQQHRPTAGRIRRR